MPRNGAHRRMAGTRPRFLGCPSGAAAVEFALLVPPLALGLLMMVDVGLALFEKMRLTQALRPAAQLALAQVTDEGQLMSAVRASLPSAWSAVTVNVSRSCECAGTGASCNVLCQGGQPPAIFTTVAADKGYTPILLPPFSIATAIEVRTR
jgi:Flp pilus assembly protein TadG